MKKHCFLIFVVALLLRLGVLYELRFTDPIEYKSDMRNYYFRALDFLEGAWPEPRPFIQQPLMPLQIVLSLKFLGPTTISPRILNCIIGALACALLLTPATELFNKKVGLLSAWFLVVYRGAVYHDTAILDVSITTLTIVVMLWGIARPRIYRILVVGLVTTLGILGRGHLLAPAAGMVFWFVLKKNYRAAVTLVITLLIFLLPIVVRNAYYGAPGLTMHTSYTLWLGNNPRSDGLYNNRTDAAAEQLTQKIAEKNSSLTERVVRYVMIAPLDWGRLMLRKIALFFLASDGIGYNNVYLLLDLKHSWILNILPGYPVFLILAFGALIRKRKSWREFVPLAVIFVPYAVMTIIFLPYARFRIPITTILIILSAVYVNELVNKEWPLLKQAVVGRLKPNSGAESG